jgi:hypothetical protein
VTEVLWRGFLELSLWVEALTIHEWSLFTETVQQPGGLIIRRGDVYTLLTDRPDNRRPLDWERNKVDLMLMEGQTFSGPWTGMTLRAPADHDLHLMPVCLYLGDHHLWRSLTARPGMPGSQSPCAMCSEGVLTSLFSIAISGGCCGVSRMGAQRITRSRVLNKVLSLLA